MRWRVIIVYNSGRRVPPAWIVPSAMTVFLSNPNPITTLKLIFPGPHLTHSRHQCEHRFVFIETLHLVDSLSQLFITKKSCPHERWSSFCHRQFEQPFVFATGKTRLV